MRKTALASLAVASLIASAAPGAADNLAAVQQSAANLVTNPTFAGGIAPWAPFGGGSVATFDSLDAVGSGTSGSVHITDNLGQGSISEVGQCIPITSNGHYRFRADVLFPTGQPSATVGAFYNRYASSNCTGTVLDGGAGPDLGARGQSDHWQRMENGNLFANDAAAHSILLTLGITRRDTSATPIVANFDNVVVESSSATGTCEPSTQDLCLSGFRFQVSASWRTSQASGSAFATQLTDDSGVFTFFDPNNIEVVLKVINACAFNHRFWVYAAGTTDQQVTITVTDTKNGTSKPYTNALGHAFSPILDSSAFATCP